MADKDMVQKTVRLPSELWARLEAYGTKISAVEISYNAALKHALTTFLDSQGIAVPPSSGGRRADEGASEVKKSRRGR